MKQLWSFEKYLASSLGDVSKLKREEYNILGTAHLKLAIAYTKKGWWEYALNEAKRSFEITPNKDCHDLISLIDEKITLKKKND